MEPSAKYLYHGESVCIGRKGTIDKPLYLNEKFWTVDTLFFTHSFHTILPRFLYGNFQRINWKQYNEASGVPSLSKKTIEQIQIKLPSTLPEQQKIADFLTAVDQRIQLLERKHKLLKDYKKGVMQQIFSQKLRFKDEQGHAYPDWEEKRLGEVAKRNIKKNTDNTVVNVLTNSATQGIINQRDYFDKDIANKNNLKGYYVVQVDDFIYNPRISNSAPVGPIKRNKLKKGVMSPLYSVFKFITGDNTFFQYYFETMHWHSYMKGIANYGARHDRMNITTGDFLRIPLPFPTLPEQHKIADFLTAIDTKIEHTHSQLENMKCFKKALLQQMFI